MHPGSCEDAGSLPEEAHDVPGIPAAMPDPLSDEECPPGHLVAVMRRRALPPDESGNPLPKFRSSTLIGVDPERPLAGGVTEREVFCRCKSLPRSDDHVLCEGSRELRGPVGALRGDNHELVGPANPRD